MIRKSEEEQYESWIEPLRRHSWEIELLLTGFVLFGLFQIPETLELIQDKLWIKIGGESVFKYLLLGMPIRVLLVGVRIMTFNLIVLLLLRGFWIGMIGLSSAFPEGIDHENLCFNERFANYLRKKSIDSEHIIIRLDNICSSIFALSFLLFFITISMALFAIQFQVFNSFGQWFTGNITQGSVLQIPVSIAIAFVLIFYLLSGFLKLIDFISVGMLKRIGKKWFTKPYFFISRFISYLTLAFLYRPIYYYLVSNFPKKVIRIILIFYMVITIGMFFGLSFNSHIYYPQTNFSSYNLLPHHYENLKSFGKDDHIITSPLIQSDVIKDNYIKLFIPYDINIHNKLLAKCEDLKPIDQYFRAKILDIGYRIKGSDVKKSLDCFSKVYSIAVDDSVYNNLKMLFYEHPNNNEKGIMTYIPIQNLNRGYHKLIIKEADEVSAIIHFWKE